MRLLLGKMGLEEDEDFFTNHRIYLEWFWNYPGRRKITSYPVDIFVPEYNVVIEVDGSRWHCTEEDKLAAIKKKENLTLSGYFLIRKTDRELVDDYRSVLIEIKSIFNRFEEPLFSSFRGDDKKLIWIAVRIIDRLKEVSEQTTKELSVHLGVAEVYIESTMRLLERDGTVILLLSHYSLTETLPFRKQFTPSQAIAQLQRIEEWCIEEKKMITINWQHFSGILKSHRNYVTEDRDILQRGFGAEIIEKHSIFSGSYPKFDIFFMLRLDPKVDAMVVRACSLSSSSI